MRIYNSTIFDWIADLWNVRAHVENEREQAWCGEAVRAELRASGESPDKALGEAVHDVARLVSKIEDELKELLKGE